MFEVKLLVHWRDTKLVKRLDWRGTERAFLETTLATHGKPFVLICFSYLKYRKSPDFCYNEKQTLII